MRRSYAMKKIFSVVFVFIFACAFLIIGILTWGSPKKYISEQEKRKLATFPVFSISGLLNGSFTDSISIFFAEHFYLREKIIPYAVQFSQWQGLQIEKVKVYQNNHLLEGELKITNNLLANNTVNQADTIQTRQQNVVYPKDEYAITENISLDSLQELGVGRTCNNVFICNGKGFQFFGGNHHLARYFAKVVDRYAEQNQGVNVYAAVVPSNAEFYLPSKYQKLKRSECANIDATNSALKKAIPVNICEEIRQHLNEYLYFNTDHHWTALGAYYGYVAWCKAAHMKPVPLDSMKRKVIKNYYGSLYHLTQDPELAQNKDSVEYFKTDIKTKTFYWLENQMDKTHTGFYLVEFASSATAYGVFLGADYPLMHIATNLQTNRNCLIIKNSYGNPFTTFLVNHFDNIFVVDYRYYHKPLNQLIKEKKITDIIFLMGVFSTNTPQHIRKVDLLLQQEQKTDAKN